jgi:hypothetical protein
VHETVDDEGDRKCHGNAPFVAHFRRTMRLQLHHHREQRELGSIMTHSNAEMAKKTNPNIAQANSVHRVADENAAQNAGLDGHYHKIGISAVAAAARYQGVAINPAYAPVQTDWRLARDAAA